MKFYILLIMALFVFNGCLVTTRTIEQPRTDLEITGNQGCLSGKCKPTPRKKKLSDKRLISVLEIELGEHPKEGDEKKVSDASESKSLVLEEVSTLKVLDEETEEVEFDTSIIETDDFDSVSDYKEKQVEVTVYTVKKGDTLQKISQKFYGTTKRYLSIYQANTDSMKSKDSLRVGQKLKIPK